MKKLKGICVALFCIIISIPIVAQALGVRTDIQLNGVGGAGAKPDYATAGYLQGDFQKDYDNWFSKAYGFYGDAIRLNNQIKYNFFNVANGTVIVGKNGQLFEQKYVDEYLGLNKEWNATQEEIDKRTAELKTIQDYLSSKGKSFSVMITPSKADFLRDAIPERYFKAASVYGQEERAYYKLLTALKKQDILYTDSVELLKSQKNEYPLFPKTGIHWSQYGAIEIVGELFNNINTAYSVKLPTISAKAYNKTDTALDGEDVDLYNLLNLINGLGRPNETYYYADLQIDNHGEAKKSFFMQGGSFMWKTIRMFQKTNAFQNLETIYYDSKLTDHSSGQDVGTPLNGFDIKDETTSKLIFDTVMNSDVIVFEINEQRVSNMGTGFYSYFIQCIEKYGK